MNNNPHVIVLTPSEGILMESRDNTLHPVSVLDIKSITEYMLSNGHVELCTDILPPNTVFYKKQNDKIVVITELKPQCRTIKFERLNGGITTRKLSFPFMYFVNHINATKRSFMLNQSFLLCSNDRINSLNSKVYRMFLNNISQSAKICWGDAYTEEHSNLSDLIDNIITSFFSSSFNSDYQFVLRRSMGDIESYDNWEKITRSLGDKIESHYDYWSQYRFRCKKSLMDIIQ